MASESSVRQDGGGRVRPNPGARRLLRGPSPPARRLRVRRIALLALSLAGAASLAGLALLVPGGRDRTGSPVPAFLVDRVGAAGRAQLPSVATPAFSARIARDGFTAASGGVSVHVSTGRGGGWRAYAHGAARRTPFGSETVVVGAGSIEQFTRVDRRLGSRIWRWRLGDLTVEPRLRDGTVTFGSSPLHVQPVSVFDLHGRNVTPAGARWALRRSRGTWWLELRLDDARLPLPYVIDPSVSSLSFSGTRTTAGSTATYTIQFTTSNPNGALVSGNTITATFASGYALPAAPSVALLTNFSGCSVGNVATSGTNNTQVVITLAGAGCQVAKRTATSLSIGGVTNPATSGLYTNSLATTSDSTTVTASTTIAAATSTSTPTFTASTLAAAARAAWTASFTTSTSGSMAAGDAITLTLPGAYTVPSLAASDVTLGGAGFTGSNCGVGGVSTSGGGAGNWSIVVTLADSGGTCTVGNSAALTVRIAGLTNPAASTQAAASFTARTSEDTAAKAVGAGITISAATKATALGASGTPQTGGARSTWSFGFTTSAAGGGTSGALGPGDSVAVTFPAGFAVNAPTVTLTSGFSAGCSGAASVAGQVVTVALSGATCSLAASTAATLKITGVTNSGAGTVSFGVATSVDALTQSVSATVAAATAVTGVAFSGSPQTAGSTASWTVAFTTSGTGALSAGDSLTIAFNGTFTVPASPAVSLGAAFGGSCSGSGSGSGTTVTILLSGTCTLAASTVSSVTVDGLTNPARGTYAGSTFTVATTRDTATASPSNVAVPGAPTAVSFSAGSTVYGASTTWTETFTATSTGALSAGNAVTVTFDPAFAAGIPAAPAVTFGSGFSGCGAGATGVTASNVVTITLPSGCSLAASATGSVAIAGMVNPVPATYSSTSFEVHTTGDPGDAGPGTGVTIGKATLTVTGITAANKSYDATTAATLDTAGATLVGVVSPDSVTLSTAGATGTFATADAGTAIAVGVAGLTIGGANAGNYTLAQPTTAADITAKALTITAGNQTKTYGTAFTFAGTEFATSGLVGADAVSSVTLSSGGAAATATVAGSPYSVTPSAAVFSSGSAADYAITYADGSFTVGPKALTITAGDQTKTYGTAFTFAGTEFTTSGLVNGDTVASVTLTSGGAGAGAAVGSYAIVPGAATGTGLGNYTIGYANGAFTVGPKGLTITAGNQTKVYGTAFSFAGTEFTASGLVNGDSVASVTLTSAGAPAAAGVGGSPYPIVPSAATGTGLGNYTITYADGSLTVSTAALTVTATDQAKTYGTAFSFAGTEFTTSGLVNGDTVTSVTIGSGGAAAAAAAGSYTITPSGAAFGSGSSANYTITYADGTFTVNTKPLTVTAGDRTKTYGGVLTFAGSEFTASGLVGGDTVSSVTLTSGGAGAAAGVGSYTIVPSAATGTGLGNYAITYADGTLTVSPKALTVTANDQTKIYGTGLTFTGGEFITTGLVNGDTVGSVTLTSGGAAAGAGVGSYTIVPGAATGSGLGNYTIGYADGTLTVSPAALTITASDQSKTYGATLGFAGSEFTTNGLANGDTIGSVTLTSSGTGAGAAAGTYLIVPGGATGTGLANYTITYANGTLTVDRKPLTITADDAAKTYGTGLTFTGGEFTASGLVNGDTVASVTLTTTGAAATANAGTYSIVPGAAAGTGLANYTITYADGSLTVDPKPLTITANDQTKTYGTGLTFTGGEFTGNGLVNGDAIGSVTLTSGGAAAGAAVGTYPIVPSAAAGSGLDNYAITYAGGTLTVSAKPLTIAGVAAQSKIYDGTTAATLDFTGASLVGAVSGDDVSIDASAAAARFPARDAGTGLGVTVTNIALAGTDAGDYTLSQPGGLTADITRRAITVTAQPDSKAYDGTTASSVVPQVTGGTLAAGDTASFTQSFDSPAVGTGKTITPSGTVVDGNGGNDYAVTFVSATGEITPTAATKVVFTSAPDAGIGGTPFATQPTVAVEDAFGNVVTSDSGTQVTLSIGTDPSGGTLICTGGTTLTVTNGVASFAGCGIDRTGSGYTLTTTNSDGFADDTTPPFDVAAVPTRLVVTDVDGGANPTAGSSFSVVVHARDGVGNDGPVASDTSFTLSLASGGGTLGGTLTGTILAGQTSATVTGVTYTRAESGVSVTATATGGDALGAGTSSPFTVDPGPAVQLALAAVPASADAVSPFSVTVDAQDAFGNITAVAADVPVTLNLETHSGAGTAGTLSGGTATLATGGQSVTLTGVRYTRAEDITLSASAPGLSGSPASSPVAVAPGPLAKLQLLVPGESAAPGSAGGKTGVPAQQTAGVAFGVTVNAVDANWNRVAAADTVRLSSSDANAGLPADLALTGGTATAAVQLETVGSGSQTVTAADVTDGGVAASTSAAIPLAVGSVDAARSTVTGTGPVTADGSSAGTVTVTLEDGGGNPVAGKTVTLAQDAGSHSTISTASGPSDANGQVTFDVTDRTAEVVTYTATDADDSLAVARTAQVSFEDHAPPTATIGAPAAGAAAAGTLTLTATGVSDGETGVGGVTFRYCDSSAASCDPAAGASLSGTDAGGGTWTAALDTTGLVTGDDYTWEAVAADNAGNTTTTATRTFSVDDTPPSLAVAPPTPGTPSIEHWDAASHTLWLRSGGSGTFALNATASDAESGIAKVTFPALLGTPQQDVTSGTGEAYGSSTYSFANQAADVAGVTISATNGVTAGDGTRSSSASFDLKVDGSGPMVALDGALDGKTVTTGVLVGATSSDTGAGVAQVAFLYCDRTADSLCAPSIGIGTASSPTLGIYSVTWTTTGLTDGHRYAVAAISTDNVGNQSTSAVGTLTVDDSAPAVAFTAPTTSGNAYYDGTALFVKATGTGSYTLNAHAADADSGIASVTFGADAGTTAGGGDYASPGYAFDGSSTPVASSTVTVTAANGVQLPGPLTASDRLDVTADGSTPTTSVQFPANNGAYDPNTWPAGAQGCTGSQPEGLCGTVADTGSGVAAVKLAIQDLGGGRYYDGSGFGQAGQTPLLSATVNGTTWSYALPHTALATGSYELTIFGVDRVGNVETTQTVDFDYGSDLTPPDTVLTLSGATHAYLAAVGSHVAPSAGNDYDLYYSTAGSGGFTLHASSTDQSGIDHIDFPGAFGTSGTTATNGAAANPWTLDGPAYTFGPGDTTPPSQVLVTSVDTRGNSGDDTIAFLLDDAAPTGGSLTVAPLDANGYATTTSLTVAHQAYADAVTGAGLASSLLTVASAPLSDGACGTFGVEGPAADGAFAATSGTCYRFALTGTDNVGNVAASTRLVQVDDTAPSTPSAAFGGLSSGNTFDDGAGTLWYRPSAGGAFTVTAAGSTDGESGVAPGDAGYTFSSLLGGTQSGDQLHVAFGAGGIGSGSYTVHSTNRAGLDSGDATFAVRADPAPPVGGSLRVNGTAAAAAQTSSYLTSGSTVAIDSRVEYTDAGSGLASSTLTMETAPLAGDVCGTFAGATTVNGTTAQPVSSGNCYRFTLTGTDNVGNTASVSTVVEVDTTPPGAPSVVFGGLSAGNVYDDGSGTLWYRPSAGGAFSVTAAGADDPETGVRAGNAGYTFSPLSGFASAAQTGNRLDVTFDASSTGGGAYAVAATNNAGLASSPAPFAIAADTTDPTGGLLSISPYASSTTLAIGEQDFTDGQSGIAGNLLTRSDPQPAAGGSCAASGYTGATAVPLSGGSASDIVPSDGSCYEYTLTGTDHVGNTATYTAIVLVDTTAPSGGSVSSPDGLTSLADVPVDWSAGSDPESGIAAVAVQRADAALAGSTCGPFGSFTTVVAGVGASPYVDAGVSAGNCYEYRIVVTNRAGVSATFTSPATTKLTAASPIALAGGAAGAYLAGDTLYLGPAATSFGLQLTALGANGVTSADWSAGTGTLAGTAATAPSPPFASGAYTWTGTPGGTVAVTRRPTGTVDTLTVVSDTTPPTGTVQQPNGVNPSHSVPVTTSGVGDTGSGVSSIQILRAETSLAGSTCGATWSSYQPVTLSGGNDTTVQDSHCYQYRLVVGDHVGNVHTDTSTDVVEVPDVTAPTFSSAATDAAGTTLTITMSEPLDAGSVPPASRFVVAYDGVAQPAPASVQVAGSTVVLGLAAPPDDSQSVTVRYSSDGSLRDLATPTENETASFGPVAVTNDTPDTVAPTLSSATVDGPTLSLQFDEALAGAAPAAGAFSVAVDGSARPVTGAAVSGRAVTLTLGTAVTASDAVVVSYAVPALDALHDAAANPVAPFTAPARNATPPVVTPPPAPPATTPVAAAPLATAPALVGAAPEDGAAVEAARTITLTADRPVAWTGMTLTRPDGTVAPLPDARGAAASWPVDAAAVGLYVVQGSIGANGATASVLTHFTVWTSAPPVPPVEKTAWPGADGSLAAADRTATTAWSGGTFGGDAVVVRLVPKDAASLSLGAGSLALDVTAFLVGSGRPVSQLADVLDIRFPNAGTALKAITSHDGTAWTALPPLPTLELPAGQAAGWFRDSDGTVHVLTRHLSLYALVMPGAGTKLAMRIVTVRRLWIRHRTFIAVRIALTAPARVTGSFAAPDGSSVAAQRTLTPTRRAGVTVLRVPLRVHRPGIYRLQLQAEGIGQVVDRTARIRFVGRRPSSPIWQDPGPLRVAAVAGLGRARSSALAAALRRGFVVRTVADAELYHVVDPSDPHAAAAVVVDLKTVPLSTLATLHALLPELRIVGLTRDRAVEAAARARGVDVVRTTAAAVREIRALR